MAQYPQARGSRRRSQPGVGLGLALLVWLVLPGPGAAADRLVPKRGKKVEGAIVSETADAVVFNRYFSRNPGVTNPEHLIRLSRSALKRLEHDPRPEVEFWWRLKRAARDPDTLFEAGTYAAKHKQKSEARLAYALALAADPEHAGALKAIGGKTKSAKVRRGNPQLDPAVREKLDAYVAEPVPEARVALGAELAALGFPAKTHELERYRRSALLPKGYQVDVPISWHSDEQPGASYALYVPSTYTPARTWPLLIGLHGGGPDGKAGDEVVGSGPSAMNFYRDLAAERGFIVACPNARVAGWGNKPNETFVRDLITELKWLYHVDVDRIYLTGHSMGGFGTWALGPRMAADLAAVAPMAGGGGTLQPLIETKTPIFIFHSSDDQVVGVGSDRTQAKHLLGSGHDFIYTEFSNVGHGLPRSIRVDLFDFLEPRRRYDKKRKTAWPRSSFAGRVTKEEKRYLGDPMAAIRGETPGLSDLTEALRLGGGRARWASREIVAAKGDGARKAVEKVLRNAKLSFDARARAANTLAGLGDLGAGPALRRAVAEPASKAESALAVASARALAALKDPAAPKGLQKAVRTWAEYFSSKVMGSGMRFSDWERAVSTLAVLVGAWADCVTPETDAAALAGICLDQIFGPDIQVSTSKRVPQDPERRRTELAGALGRAYAASGADDTAWETLAVALEAHPAAQRAAKAARK